MSTYSPNSVPPVNPSSSTSQTWSQWGSVQYSNEQAVLKSHIPLVISTSLTTAIYSYSMIDGSSSNAINRALLMSLSTFLAGSVTNMFLLNNYISNTGNTPQIVEGALIPLVYYYITKQRFQLPDLQSQAIKTGVVASVVGELSRNKVDSYYNNYMMPPQTKQEGNITVTQNS